ncbi:MAG: hypothetical protein ACLR8Y_08180 [Alistipes indistinctus]
MFVADISGDDMPVSGVPACCGTAAAGTGCSWRASCCLRGVMRPQTQTQTQTQTKVR